MDQTLLMQIILINKLSFLKNFFFIHHAKNSDSEFYKKNSLKVIKEIKNNIYLMNQLLRCQLIE